MSIANRFKPDLIGIKVMDAPTPEDWDRMSTERRTHYIDVFAANGPYPADELPSEIVMTRMLAHCEQLGPDYSGLLYDLQGIAPCQHHIIKHHPDIPDFNPKGE